MFGQVTNKDLVKISDKNVKKNAKSSAALFLDGCKTEAARGSYECSRMFPKVLVNSIIKELAKSKMAVCYKVNMTGTAEILAYWGPSRKSDTGIIESQQEWLSRHIAQGYKK